MNQEVPTNFRSKQKGTTFFWNEEEHTEVFRRFSGMRRNERFCSKKNSDRRGTIRGIPKLFRNKEKRLGSFQKNSDRKGTNGGIPKFLKNEEKQTDLFQKNSSQRKTNRFDSDFEEKRSQKNESSSFLKTKAKSKRFDPKMNEVLTLLAITIANVMKGR